MSFSPLRYCFVLVLALSASGCYSGGRWTMPELAFWKTNPFSSTSKSTAPEALPRPSELAVQPSPPPGTGYTPTGTNTADTLAPAYPTTSATAAAGQPYSVEGPATSPYVAPQQGYYDSGPGNLTATHGGANPYSVPDTQPQPSYTSNPYAAGGPHASPTPYGATASPSQAYGTPPPPHAGGSTGYVAANPSGPYGNPVRDGGQDAYDARLADYRSTAGMYGTPSPGYHSDNSPHSSQDYRNPPADYRNQPSAGPAYAPGAPNTQAAAPPPAAGYGNTPQGYFPPPSGYSPGNTGYNPQGTPPYQAPQQTSPGGQGYDPGYSPGTVGRYDP